MSWPHRIQMIVPITLIDTANTVGRALDPDIGGDKTFSIPLPNAENPTHYGASTAAATTFVQTIQAIQAGALELYDVVAQDYLNRWPTLTPPTAEECDAFMTQVVIRIDEPWMDVITELGLVEDTGGEP